MKGVRRLNDYLKKELKNNNFRNYFEEEKIYADLAIQIAKLRQDEKFTQQDLARLISTTQQTVSRLENPHNASFSIATLIKIAQALHKNLKIQFV